MGGEKRETERSQLEKGRGNPATKGVREPCVSRGGKSTGSTNESARKRQCSVPCVNIHPIAVSACASGNQRRFNHRRRRRRRRRRRLRRLRRLRLRC